MAESIIKQPEKSRVPDFENTTEERLENQRQKRIVVLGTKVEANEDLNSLEEAFPDSRVDYTPSVENIDNAFWGLRTGEKTHATAPDYVVVYPHMRARDGELNTTIETPIDAIAELIESTGTPYTIVNERLNESDYQKIDQSLTSER